MAMLMLLRHAKSDWGSGHRDHDRPLNQRGRAAAAKMGAFIAEERLIPDQIICSTAARARETLDVLLGEVSDHPPVTYEASLYGAAASTIMQLIAAQGPEIKALMLVGHNPGFEDCAMQLAAGDSSQDSQEIRRKYPTCGLAIFQSPEGSVADLTAHSAVLNRFMTPRLLTL
ncbi:MAG: histidine phosphatase family protein [Alphaproteobacteria bacterium]|nr:histidine phosphatase family protein [Alphaproteobacteria bacterium]